LHCRKLGDLFGPVKRQRRSIAKKRKIVEQTLQPGASLGGMGRGSSISLLPVTVAEATASKNRRARG